MGTFVGHILPGTFLFIYGVFYIIRDAYSSIKGRNLNSSSGVSATQRHDQHEAGNSEHKKGNRHIHDRVEKRNTTPILESFDFDSEDEETTVFSRTLAECAFPPNDFSNSDEGGHNSDDIDTYIYNTRSNVKTRPRCKGFCKKWLTNIALIEGVLKIVCSVIGLLGELWWVNWYMISPRTGNFTNMNNWQHATMFAFFGISGIADIVFQTCLKTTPRSNHVKIFLSLAFWVEYLLFTFHTQGVSDLESDLHRLLLVAIGVCGSVSCLDVWRYRPDAPGVRRVWVTATCLQGTWFWQIGFTLYNPWRNGDNSRWEDPGSHLVLVSLFTWHLLAILLFTTVIHEFARCCAKSKCCRK